MWWRRKSQDEHLRTVDERSKENARRADAAQTKSDRLAAQARPIQAAIAEQLDRNHWAELIFGRVN
ncbi:DUF7620 family protein [Gordonia terrae]|uniref:DUF7620 family protein n=1 Tax=Gordonia terrae TaxID=2055 RepID=UPI003F6D2B5C